MKPLLGLVLWGALVAGVHAMGSTDAVSLTGVLSLKGNVPFTYLCLTDQAGLAWRLRVPATLSLGNRVGQNVTVLVRSLPPRPTGPTPYPPEVEVTAIQN